MFHDHITNLEAFRQHLIGESRAFPNPGFDKLLEDASRDDPIWLDGALSDQLDALPHAVADDVLRREMFVQISDRLARQARVWTFLSIVLFANVAMAGSAIAGG